MSPAQLIQDGDKTRAAWLLVPLLAAAVLLSACGGAATVSPAPASPTASATALPAASPTSGLASATPSVPGTVTIWLDWNQAELRTLERLIANYRELHPGAQFELVYLRSADLRPAFEAALAEDGQVPSLLFGPSDWAAPLFEAGALRDVAGSVLPEQRDAIHPLAWSQVERDGAVLGLPLELQGTLLYRNSSWATEAPATVADFVTAGQAARRAGAVGASLDLAFDQSAPLIRTCKGQFELEPGADPISQPVGLCWLRLLNRLGEAGRVLFGTDEDLTAFSEGRAAWILESSERLPALRAQLGGENLAVDSWPRYQATGERLSGYVWTENMYFPSAASDQDFEAAYAFAVYLLAPENQAILAETQGVSHIPVLGQVELEEPLLSAARAVLETGVALPDMRRYERVATELNTAVRLVVAQGSEPELALELALEEIRLATAPTATPTVTPSATVSPMPSETPFPTPPPG